MSDDIQESFNKTRVAGAIAAGALDEVAKFIKPGVTTNQIDNLCYEYIMIMMDTLRHCFTEVFQNLVVLRQIMLFAMVFLEIKF